MERIGCNTSQSPMNHTYDTADLLARRAERDEHFRTHYTSPIPEEHLATFTGLDYFDADPQMVWIGRFNRVDGKLDITSSTGATSAYRLAGYVSLSFVDGSRRLVVLHGEEGDMFIPFRDATCGSGSYGGGRYVPAILNDSDTMTVDFNLALNPWCAYDEEFSCPLPPVENWLPIEIPAGERDYRPA